MDLVIYILRLLRKFNVYPNVKNFKSYKSYHRFISSILFSNESPWNVCVLLPIEVRLLCRLQNEVGVCSQQQQEGKRKLSSSHLSPSLFLAPLACVVASSQIWPICCLETATQREEKREGERKRARHHSCVGRAPRIKKTYCKSATDISVICISAIGLCALGGTVAHVSSGGLDFFSAKF